MSDEHQRLLDQVHDGITTFDFDGKEVPCIVIEEKKYEKLLSGATGKPLAPISDMNILQDGLGNAFVEIILTFPQKNVEKFLVNAKTDLHFFECYAGTSMLALSSPKSSHGRHEVFVIQLPRPEKIRNALKIIKAALIPQRGRFPPN